MARAVRIPCARRWHWSCSPLVNQKEVAPMRRRDALTLCLSTLSWSAFGAPFAQAFPDQQIRLIVPRSAGGVVDLVARLWAEQVKAQLGSIVIENQGGGGGIIAAQAV